MLIESQKEIFVYDRDLCTGSATARRTRNQKTPIPEAYIPQEPPDTLSDESSLQAWQKLFKDRRAWAIKLSETSDAMIQQTLQHNSEIQIIRRATAIAVGNVKQHIGTLHEKKQEAKRWVEDTLRDQDLPLQSRNKSFNSFSAVRLNKELVRFFQSSKDVGRQASRVQPQPTLQSIAELDELQEITARAQGAINELRHRMQDIETAYEDIAREGNDLLGKLYQEFPTEDSQQGVEKLSEEIEVVVRKINTDYENVLTMPNNSKSVAAISKTALLHTRNFLPSLFDDVIDIGQFLRRIVERKNTLEDIALTLMQRISATESELATTQLKIANLDLSPEEGESLDALSYINQLPLVYASLLVEVVRRREWTDKITADSSSIAEEMAVHKDDEERRRKKWLKKAEEYLHHDALDNKTLGIEVNVKMSEQPWPQLSRGDVDDFVATLESVGGFDNVLPDIREMVKGLDVPSKQQMRRTNAFRNGAINDSTFGRNSLLLRGDDDLIQSLQSDKGKLEDRLKGSESRVRKLEDLLHRSSQIRTTGTQLNSGLPGHPSSAIRQTSPSPKFSHTPTGSPKANSALSRHPSLSSRRLSANYGADENNLARRIVQLEAELAAEKARSSQLEEKTSNHAEVQGQLKVQVQEATSMKKDLLDNFEAQKHEFDGERRLLEDEKRKLKLQLEELEEELDRILGSHENARTGLDEKAKALNLEIDKVRRDATEQIRKAEDQANLLEKNYNAQQDLVSELESQLQQENRVITELKQNVKDLDSTLREYADVQIDHQKALQSVHIQLAVDEDVPEDFQSLVEAIEVLAQRASDHLRDMRLVLENARAENVSLEDRLVSKEEEIDRIQLRLTEEEKITTSLREEATTHQSRFQSIANELSDERKELLEVRAKLSDGETGSEALKAQLMKEEKRIDKFLLQLASSRAAVENLNVEVTKKSKMIDSLELVRKENEARLQERAHRAGEVSLQLFLQTDRLTRLLEHIGYAISRQDDSMIIQRVTRSNTANSTTIDQSQSVGKRPSGPVPTMINDAPPEYLHWALVEDAEREHRDYQDFIHESRAFDVEAFCEAVAKRVKDTEHIARKWQREAKSYREKFHRTQLEAQQKIAFRSFKEGDLALFLPTRNQAPRKSWAAFNVGAPHYFLREQEHHKLTSRDWLLARISKVEDRVVDLSKQIDHPNSISDTLLRSDDGISPDEENPFGLSDGLRWYYLDASEDKLGAPTTPGLGKTTVASAHVAAAGSIQQKKDPSEGGATRTLARSLDSRRSSAASKKSLVGATTTPHPAATSSTSDAASPGYKASEREMDEAQRLKPSSRDVIPEEVRIDQLHGL